MTGTPASGPAAAPELDGEPEDAVVPGPVDRRRREQRLASITLGVGVGVLAVFAWHLGRSLWWFSDDWNILARYHDGHWLEPFNGHLSLVPVGIFRVLYETAGIDSYAPYRVVGLACYLGFGVFLYRYGRRQAPPMVAALGSLLLLWLSVAGFNVTFPFLVNFTIPLAATVGAWWLLEHDTRRSDLLAAGCVAVALASSGLGVVTVVAVVTELAWRRAPWARWAPHAVPVGLWAAWYLGWSESTADPGGPGPVLTYARQELQATFWALGGTNRAIGVVVAAALVGLFALAAFRWRTFDARVVSALTAFVAFIGLTAYSRVGILPRIPPDTGRYLWVNIVYLLVAVFACLRGRRLHPAAVAALAALVVFNGVVLVQDLRDYRRTVDVYAATVRVNLVATELAGDAVPGDRVLPLSLLPVTVDDYRDATGNLGSPIADVGPDALGPASDERRLADRQLVADLGLGLGPADATCPPGARGGLETPAGRTVAIDAADGDAVVHVRRLASTTRDDDLGVEVGVVPAGRSATLVLPADADVELGARFPWTVEVTDGALVGPCP